MTSGDRYAEFNAALVAGDSRLLAKLVSEGLDVNNLDSAGETPLTNSVSERFGDLGSSSRIRTLVQLGARVAKESPQSCLGTSVHLASGLGYLNSLIELLAADGRVALQTFDDLGRTPLECAVESGNVEVVRALLGAGAQPDFRHEASSEDTALIRAVRRRDLEMVKLLLSKGADPSAAGWMQMTAIDHVSGDNAPNAVEILGVLTNPK